MLRALLEEDRLERPERPPRPERPERPDRPEMPMQDALDQQLRGEPTPEQPMADLDRRPIPMEEMEEMEEMGEPLPIESTEPEMMDEGLGEVGVPVADASDFEERYNTELSPEEEEAFIIWATEESERLGKNLLLDLKDYDLRGFWKDHGVFEKDGNFHYPDTYKKPNHPTFSEESIYHGVDGYEGGRWVRSRTDGPSFEPGPTNLDFHEWEELQEYFQQVEPGVALKRMDEVEVVSVPGEADPGFGVEEEEEIPRL